MFASNITVLQLKVGSRDFLSHIYDGNEVCLQQTEIYFSFIMYEFSHIIAIQTDIYETAGQG